MKAIIAKIGPGAAITLLLASPAFAVAVQYQNADGYNTTSVSVATPLPVTGTVTAAATNTYQATASAAISISTATTTEIVALSGTKAIYISHIDFISGGTGNVTLEYGTGTACATGTTVLTGAYGLLTGSGLSAGNGVAPFLFVPAGKAFCILTSANVQLSGAVAYAQF